MKNGTLYGISLGPGDPGLITVKGLALLRDADRIYFAGSSSSKGGDTSYALQILDALGLEKTKLRGVYIPMSEDMAVAERAYNQAFEEIHADCAKGLRVAFACEGDISFYSTFSRLLARAKARNLPVEIIAGVPAFLLGAAVEQRVLATGTEKIAFLPRLRDTTELERCLVDFDVVVLIKIRGVIEQVSKLAAKNAWSLVLCEKLGSADQFVSTDPEVLERRQVPYLSLLIVRKEKS